METSEGSQDVENSAIKKRKADELVISSRGGKESKEDGRHAATDLPLPIWGQALEYLPYKGVRSTFRVCKFMAQDVPNHVRVISIMDGAEMDVPAARAFVNVAEVNILCAVSVKSDERARMTTYIKLHPDVLWKVVPFLSTFTKLKRVYLGALQYAPDLNRDGTVTRRRIYYFGCPDRNSGRVKCDEPENHASTYCHFVDSFVGAIKSRLLPQNMEAVHGLIENHAACRGERCMRVSNERWIREDPNDPCSHCRDVLQYFPIEDVLMAHKVQENFCVPVMDRCSIISKRPGGKEGLKKGMEELLNSVIYSNIPNFTYQVTDADRNTEFWHRCINSAPQNPGNPGALFGLNDRAIFFFPDSYFEDLDALIANLDLSPADFKNKSGSGLYGYMDGSPLTMIWAKSSLEKFASRGLMDPVQIAYLPAVLVDDQNERALQGLRDRMSEF